MPATARKLNSSESSGTRRQITERWQVVGASDRADAKSALVAAMSPTVSGLALKDYGVNEAKAPGVYDGFAEYSPTAKTEDSKPLVDPPEVGDEILSFSTIGGSERIFVSRGTYRYTFSGGTLADFKGIIGYHGGTADGVDVHRPKVTFSRRTAYTDAQVTDAYRATLSALTGTVNDAPFWGYAANEVLFLGASMTQRNGGDWEVEFQFAVSPNATDIVVGSITVAMKKGWEYLWVYTQEVVDATANRRVTRPVQANVEIIYPQADFAGLEPAP